MRVTVFFIALLLAPKLWAAHGYALWGDLKYPPGFSHFDYVNPQAPKGGEIVLVSNTRISNFDKYNPFSIKGSAPSYLAELAFESLLTSPLDEANSAYGLLAEDVSVASDRLSATFQINRAARFNNGDPVLAEDVKHSYRALISKQAPPQYRALLQDVSGVTVLGPHTIRFDFKVANRELPLTVGGLPVFSRKWGAGKAFDAITKEEPIASGPYRIGPVVFGRDITYVRDPNYWARDLNTRRGTFNFDRVTVKIYKDTTARLEGLKAGEFDFNQEFISRDWARAYRGRRFDSGQLVKKEFVHQYPHGFQVHIFNQRVPKYRDLRVRKALSLAFDFEWMNRQLFYGIYKRGKGYFGGSEFEALASPDAAELALLEPWRAQLPPEVFGPVAYPPSTAAPRSLRQNLREARELLAQAGWTYRDGALRNAKGEPFVMEYLDSRESGLRTLSPWIRNLEKLGIRFEFRQMDFAVYQERLRKFQFDVGGIRLPGTNNPGSELLDLFGSKAATQEDSNNLWGIQDPVVDALIAKLVQAQTREQANTAGRALDRVLIHGWHSLHQWYSNSYRVAYDQSKFHLPAVLPKYFSAETWAIGTWWAKTKEAGK